MPSINKVKIMHHSAVASDKWKKKKNYYKVVASANKKKPL